MRKIQKKVLMAMATVVIFSSVALADGDMGGSGLWSNEPAPTKVTERAPEDGDMGGGGRSGEFVNGEYGIDWLLNSIGELLGLSD